MRPPGSGKTIILQNRLLDIFKCCYSRMHMFSPSADIGHTWQPVRITLQRRLKRVAKERT